MHCLFVVVVVVVVFIMRGIFNIMCGGLNNMCCHFLIMHSGYIIMRCRSSKWCSILILTCCEFVKCRTTFLLCKVCFTLFAVDNCILTLNIYKYTTSSSMHSSFFVMRGIFNIMCGGLNNMRCSVLIMRSSFIIMRSRSCKWCSRLLFVMHLLSVALLFLLCTVGITLFAIDHPLFAVVKLLCATDIFFQLNTLP